MSAILRSLEPPLSLPAYVLLRLVPSPRAGRNLCMDATLLVILHEGQEGLCLRGIAPCGGSTHTMGPSGRRVLRLRLVDGSVHPAN